MVWRFVHMSAGVFGGCKMVLDILDLELQALIICCTWELRIKQCVWTFFRLPTPNNNDKESFIKHENMVLA